ncbi:MAG: putative membrane protein YdjX (TVP38/TMEM64 family) [Myxococcota bacterium]|jgi:uncharacterized membrane protein YdjX (TVP38/TMEM64 family)
MLARVFKWTHIGWIAAAVLVVFGVAQLPLKALLVTSTSGLDEFGGPGALLFVFIYAVLCNLFVPRSLITLVAGLGWGMGMGLLLAMAGSLVGAAMGYLIGRNLLRETADRLAARHRRLQALNHVALSSPIQLTILWHLSLILPFALINYWMGAARIGLRPFFFGKVVGVLPSTTAYVYFGTLIPDAVALLAGAGPPQGSKLWIGVVAIIMTVGTLTWIARTARHSLRRLETR